MSFVRLGSVFKDYLWGGTRLRDDFGKKSSLEKLAESWELACHKDGSCTVESGELKGVTLEEYINTKGKSVLGTSCEGGKAFPLLIKLIDAKDDLSVQVHPDDEYALRTEGELGKTEMWYVIDCEKNSKLIYGFKEELSKERFEQMISNNTFLDAVNSVPVKKGDVFFIPSGTLHAIGKGILVAEIQENSNTTYRVYDYGRLGADGNPRQLHIKKAIEVTDTRPAQQTRQFPEVEGDGFSYRLLARCGYFTAMKFDVRDSLRVFIDGRSFAHLLMLDGSGKINCGEELEAAKGDSFFADAGSGSITIKGKCSFILTRNGCEEGIDGLVEK